MVANPVLEKVALETQVSPELLRILRRYADLKDLPLDEVIEAGLVEFLLHRVSSIYKSDFYEEEFPCLRAMRFPGLQ